MVLDKCNHKGWGNMKKWILSVLILLIGISLSAASFKIVDYDFDVSGKTMDFALKRIIVPSNEEVFDSEESLVKALDGKKQRLINQRVFKEVEYSYFLGEDVDDVIPVSVFFKIKDARSFLVLPYPKYDSNIGTRLGVRLWDSNFLGSLANLTGVVHATFEDNDWSDPLYYGKFELTDFLLGQTTMSFSLFAEGRAREALYDYSVSSSFTHIPLLFGTWLDFGLSGAKSGEGVKYALSSSIGGIKLGPIGISPSFSAEHYDKAPASCFYTPSLSLSGISIGNIGISFSDSAKFIHVGENKELKPEYVTHVTNLAFNGDFLHGVSFSNTTTYYPLAAENATDLYFYNTASYSLSDVSTLYLMENIATATDTNKVSYFDTGVGLSQRINIGSKVSVTPKLSEYLRIYPTESGLEYARYYILEASTSGNYVNWVGNYRNGIEYRATISEAWMQKYNVREAFGEKGGVFDHFEVSAYKLLWGWFNPSVRVIFNYAVNKGGYGYIFGSSASTLAEELRGIRNNQVADSNMLAFVANINLLSYFPLPSFFSFFDAYANVFFDYALVKRDLATPAENFYGIGFEGIGILKDYPSYPIRLSVGFDLEQLVEYINHGGSKGFYEIYFGMGFLF